MKKRGQKEMKRKTTRAIAFAEIFLFVSFSFAVAAMMSEEASASDGGANVRTTPLSTTPSPSASTSVAGSKIPATDIGWDAKHPIQSIYGGKADLGISGTGGQVAGSLVAGIAWAATAYVAVKLIGSLIGLKDGAQKALENAALAGGFVGGFMHSVAANNFLPELFGAAESGVAGSGGALNFMTAGGGFPAGLIVAAAVFILTYSEQSTKTVTFTCMPYEPPTGGSKCEQCNGDKFRPCSEYRCKSLGQACQLLNKGTGDEKCAWVNPKDVNSPVIQPWTNPLTTGFKYTPNNAIRPPNRGVKIISSSTNGCVKAFTPLTFGLTLNEPAQCKLDYARSNQTGKAGFDAMQFYFGGSNYYEYNHTQAMRLPSPASFDNNSAPLLQNGDTMNLYVKCMDANGNVNEDDFVFTFCVDKGPDTTPPIVEGTSISNNGFVQYNVDHVPIEVYTNEPAQCKWSRVDKDYNDMENSMQCAQNIGDVNADLTFTCSGNLTAIKNSEANNFFFRCKDYPDNLGAGNNEMQQSYRLTLAGSQPLKILDAGPNGTIKGNTEITPVAITVKTDSGAEEGKAVCYYSATGARDSYIQMYYTNNYISSQVLDLGGSSTGTNYNYLIRCIDAGGNVAETSVGFKLFVDKDAPVITRAYKEGPDALKIITSENSTCGYSLTSCNFNINESQLMVDVNSARNIHAAEWKNNAVYYIKCMDDYGNYPGNDCSMIVNAIELNKRN